MSNELMEAIASLCRMVIEGHENTRDNHRCKSCYGQALEVRDLLAAEAAGQAP
jgi:hypothetical protein